MNTRQARGRRSSGAAILIFRLLAVAGIAGAAGVSGCGGGSGSPMSSRAPASGVAMVTLTDAPGDFLSYQLAVVSLKLTRADGTAVETLPAPSKVEFAQLANLSEVISARQVSTGTYTGVSMTLDYSGATIVVDNGAGGLTVPAANIMNGATNGALVSPNNQLTLTLKLSSNAPLVISDHANSSVALDFNLSASNTIAPASLTSSTLASAVTVTVQPMLSAGLAPDASKPVRVRGKLLSVDTSASSYTVNVPPFPDPRDSDDEQFSRSIAVTVAGTTAVTEDGQSGSFSAQDISVGQRLQLFGTFGTDSSGNRTLDASSGSARLMLTPLWGQFISSAGGVVTVKLQSLGGIDPAMLNFAGTGSSAANDATASAYQVSFPSTLPVPSLTAGSPIPFLGFVRPFGSAPPDFSAAI